MGIEAALLGAAAPAAGTAAAAGATALGVSGATAGLIGSGGTLFGISGLTTSTLGTGLSALSGLSSISSGMEAKAEGKRQAELARFEAGERAKESVRVSDAQGRFAQQEADTVRRQQKMAYLSSGVSLEGSPLLVMEGTRARGAANMAEYMRSGTSAAGAAYSEGRLQAGQLKRAGRQSFYSGLGSAANSFSRLF